MVSEKGNHSLSIIIKFIKAERDPYKFIFDQYDLIQTIFITS